MSYTFVEIMRQTDESAYVLSIGAIFEVFHHIRFVASREWKRVWTIRYFLEMY